ncbi:hypothetical protein AJ79_03670 [Helicocarpus griseus UAMH5409]|uniref:Transcription factor hoxa13 n=1 Tax=Helicocarpus griseus UAMH5409 TaxID=1447875 RepID=A0A2B7XX96_9EURO|nr:hypothetical protein AJ79_03670 [Helicocarpus griseus UAMH5409]
MAGDGTVAGNAKGHDGQSFQNQHRKRPVSFVRWSIGAILRLFVWYALLWPFLYCPSTLPELDSNSPRVCKPYLITRSHIEPHILPTYETHGAPYVDAVRPYAQTFNEKVYSPAANFVSQNYHTYGAPHVEKGVSYVHSQWEAIAEPHILSLQDSLSRAYESSIEPHYKRATTIVTPYYRTAATHLDHVSQSYILPFYTQSKPMILRAYSSTYDIAVHTVYPHTRKAWSSVVVFINDTLLPGVTGLYSENVEPQLVRIGEKLATYREGRKLGAVVNDTEIPTGQSTSTASASPSAITTAAPKPSVYSTVTTSTSAPPPEQSVDKVALAREKIATDLRTWQEKFAVAADKGTEDLDERVAKIVENHIQNTQRLGEELVSALETVGKKELESLKAKINNIVHGMPEKSSDEHRQAAGTQLVQAVRTSGFAVRTAAQRLRQWLGDFDSNLSEEVSAATDATVEVLDQIRDLGLQNIGMKWAWMDGVTYKDWAKYNALKKQFRSWREEVRDVGMKHSAYEEAKAFADEIVNKGMSIAEATAKELTRLKEVGKWKIEAEDISEDFETPTIDAAEARASRRAAMGLDEPDEGTSPAETEAQPEPEYSTSPPETEPSQDNPADQEPLVDTDTVDTPEPSDDDEELESGTSVADEQDEPSPASPKSSPTPEIIVEDEDNGTGDNVWGGAAAEFIGHEDQVPANSPEQARDETSSQQLSTSSNVPSEQTSIPMPPPEASSLYIDSVSQAKKIHDIAHSVASAQDSGAPEENIVASIESAYSGSLQDASEKLESRLTAASEYAGIPSPSATQTVDDDVLVIASAKLQQDLETASLDLASAMAVAATETPAPGQQVILDARRRYYEAIGLAHDQYSIFINNPSASIQPEVASTSTSKPSVDDANSEFSIVSQLASASLDAVLYSVNSAESTMDPASASSIVEDAATKFHDALSAAASSLDSVSSESLETPTASKSSQSQDARETADATESTDAVSSETIREDSTRSSPTGDVSDTPRDEL